MNHTWKLVELDGVGAVEVRPFLVRDMVGADATDPAFWWVCVRHAGGAAFTRDDALDLPMGAANLITAEVMKSRFTPPPSVGSGG